MRDFRFIAQELGSEEYFEYPFSLSEEMVELTNPDVLKTTIRGFAEELADKLLAHLRQSDAPPGSVVVETKDGVPPIATNTEPWNVEATPTASDAPQGCCDECKNPAPFGITRFGYRNCFNPDCPNCHKKAPQGDNKPETCCQKCWDSPYALRTPGGCGLSCECHRRLEKKV